MRKYLFSGLLGIILLVIAACGGDDATAVPAAATIAPAAPTQAPTAAAATQAPASGQAPAANTLASIAAKLAGGPGAFYLGDLNQLVGPAASKGEGDADGNVPLGSLQNHLYVYESDYYKGLIEKANFTNPTQLVSEGQDITIQHACVNRALVFCKIVESYFAPNLEERTNGQLKIVPTSFPELGIAGPDSLALVADGTLDMASILGVYVAGELPALEIQFLFGLYTAREDQYNATTALAPDLEKLVTEASGGAKLINFNWHSGDDIFLFTKKPLRGAEDLVGLKVRSFGTAIADWIRGMGADAQFMAFSEVYTALERGVIDAGVTGGDAGHGQRWYEVTDFINGPLTSWPTSLNIMNKDIWDQIPADMQQILIEEGAKTELEALRVGAIQNELGLQKNIEAGLEFVEFNAEMRELSDRSVLESVMPNWVQRVGGPDQHIVQVFNEKIGTIIGLRVEADGTIVSAAIKASTTPTVSAELRAYADANAGGPGAIYIGDISQLAGPSPGSNLGDADDNVPLASLQRQEWIYDNEYYRSLLKKAKLENPTELVTSGFSISIQHACINRALLPCEVINAYWVPNIKERTNGQINLVVTSFPELGLAGPDTLSLVEEGTLDMANIYTGYVAGELPSIEVNSLWGIYPDLETMYLSLTDMHSELEEMVLAETGGVVLNHNWFAGNDQFFFSRKKLETLEDFKGMKTRSHAAALSDWIEGMGAEAQFIAFSEVYTALERGIIDAGVTGANPGYGQRWYEVAPYLVGPLKSFLSTNNVINSTVWAKIPPDLQQILLEEGAKTELEQLRLASIQNETGTLKNIEAGMELVEFSQELADHSFNVAVVQHVIPGWLRRLGGADHPAVDLFNEKVGPYVGIKIESDGTVVIVPKTK